MSVVGADETRAQDAEVPPVEGGASQAPTASPAVDEADEVTGPLRVGVTGSAPFVVDDDGEPSGISVAIWRAMMESTGQEYELVEVASPDEAIDRVESGELDVAVGPLSISSERAERVAFTQPYYESELAIAAPIGELTLADHLAPFVSKGFLGGVAFLLLVLFAVGAVTWAVERKHNDSISQRPLHGIATGVWLALVTMTTVGYGDRVPETPAGRVVIGIWMLVSLVVVSSLTAFLATALTVSELATGGIEGATDLAGRRVAVVDGTTSVSFARRFDAELAREPSLADAVQAVVDGEAEAVVYDRPILQWQLQSMGDHGLHVVEQGYDPLGYGFALGRELRLDHELDAALLGLFESGELDELVARWLDS